MARPSNKRRSRSTCTAARLCKSTNSWDSCPPIRSRKRLDSSGEGEPMTATDAQVRLMMRERTNGKTQQQAAVKVNMHSRKTVQKYEQLGQLPTDKVSETARLFWRRRADDRNRCPSEANDERTNQWQDPATSGGQGQPAQPQDCAKVRTVGTVAQRIERSTPLSYAPRPV